MENTSDNQQNQPQSQNDDSSTNQSDNSIDWNSAEPSHDEGSFKGGEDLGIKK